MKLSEAAKAGIRRVRKAIWASPGAYLRIDIMPDGSHGPWLRLYDRPNQEAIEEPTPQQFLHLGDSDCDYEEYTGPKDTADTED